VTVITLRPALAAAFVVVLTAAGCLSIATRAGAQPPPNPAGPLPLQPTPEQIAHGRRLFDGSIALARGGPACAACHAAASVPAAGGTMGPDLTGVTQRMGREGLASALQTLYFPTMYPLFAAHQLTPEEQTAIGAFLESTSGQTSHAARDTILIVVAAAILCAILFAVTGALGRSRVGSVRRTRLPRSAGRVPRRGATA
jgi:mono/diheme cytochrome c family protein